MKMMAPRHWYRSELFFLRYLGVSVDAYSEDTDGPFIDNTSANVIFRIPIELIHLAPYVYGGGWLSV